jgi:hypothetical protein
MIPTMLVDELSRVLDTRSLVLVQLPTPHASSRLLLSPLRHPTDLSVRLYRADGFQVKGRATFRFFPPPPPARFVGANLSAN